MTLAIPHPRFGLQKSTPFPVRRQFQLLTLVSTPTQHSRRRLWRSQHKHPVGTSAWAVKHRSPLVGVPNPLTPVSATWRVLTNAHALLTSAATSAWMRQAHALDHHSPPWAHHQLVSIYTIPVPHARAHVRLLRILDGYLVEYYSPRVIYGYANKDFLRSITGHHGFYWIISIINYGHIVWTL